MKYARYSILLGVLLVAGCVFAATQPPAGVPTQESQAQWKVVVPQTLFADKLRMAAFLNENFGSTEGLETLARLATPQMAAKPGPWPIAAGADCTTWTSWMSRRSGNVA